MKYTESALLSQLSGSAGSTTASRNRYGSYLRTRTNPVNPNSIAQQTERNNLASLSASWRDLSEVDRTAWSAAAASVVLYDSLGRAYTPSGAQYYISVGRNRFLYSGVLSVGYAIPVNAAPATPLTLSIGIDNTPNVTAAYTATPTPALTKFVLEGTRGLSPGVNFVGRSQYRTIALTAAAAASPLNALAGYQAAFGDPVPNTKTFFRMFALTSEGRRSAYITDVEIVAEI